MDGCSRIESSFIIRVIFSIFSPLNINRLLDCVQMNDDMSRCLAGSISGWAVSLSNCHTTLSKWAGIQLLPSTIVKAYLSKPLLKIFLAGGGNGTVLTSTWPVVGPFYLLILLNSWWALWNQSTINRSTAKELCSFIYLNIYFFKGLLKNKSPL